MDEINKKLSAEAKQLISKIESGELRPSIELDDMISGLKHDRDKIALFKYVLAPIKVSKSLESEESKVEAIGTLSADKQKSPKILQLKLALSREGFKKIFLREEEKKYNKIGLDKNITIGIEMETLGKNSEKILEAGEKNGITIHKEKQTKCGKIVKRRE